MTGVLRRGLVILMMSTLAAPAVGALCGVASGCPPQDSTHECCDMPRLSDCECGNAATATLDEAEPARRVTDEGAPIARAAATFALIFTSPDSFYSLDAGVIPPPDTGGRLSLLSVLIV